MVSEWIGDRAARLLTGRRRAERRWRRAGDEARDAGDWARAASAYAMHIELHPDDWAIWVQRGHALAEMGDVGEAIAAYRRAAELSPQQPDPLLHLGRLLRSTGSVVEAIAAYRRAAALGEQLAAGELAVWRDDACRQVARGQGLESVMAHRDRFAAMVAGSDKQIWVGVSPPMGMEAVDLWSRPNLRAEARLHGQYDVAWLYEQPLSASDPSQWPLLLDETIRLLRADGRLIVRYAQNDTTSVMKIRGFLGRRPGITVTMEPPVADDGLIHDIYHIARNDFSTYQERSWSFIILAQGNRTPTVVALLEQLREARNTVTETIIVGPRLPEYQPFDVFVLDKPYRSDYAQIALKKNDAASFAVNANLCIMHDRFMLDSGFFDGFDAFGYDFDFVAVRQRYPGGEPYPFVGELSGPPMIWSVPIHTATFQHVRPTHFVNGGLMVFKRAMFARLPFNPLLAWNEGEDVEITNFYLQSGIPPRVNLFSSATTTVSVAHTAMFLPDV